MSDGKLRRLADDGEPVTVFYKLPWEETCIPGQKRHAKSYQCSDACCHPVSVWACDEQTGKS